VSIQSVSVTELMKATFQRSSQFDIIQGA